MLWPLFLGFMLSITWQGSGIDAMVAFAPGIFSTMTGISPLLCNLFFQGANFLCTWLSPYYTKLFKPRRAFILSTFLVASSLGFVGVFVMPGLLPGMRWPRRRVGI